VKSVLFDAAGRAAARGAFATKAPADLIDCDLIGALVPWSGQFERRGNGCATAPDNGDFYRLSVTQSPLPYNRRGPLRPMPRSSNVFNVARSCGIGKTFQLARRLSRGRQVGAGLLGVKPPTKVI
jgi:hypothetical protein